MEEEQRYMYDVPDVPAEVAETKQYVESAMKEFYAIKERLEDMKEKLSREAAIAHERGDLLQRMADTVRDFLHNGNGDLTNAGPAKENVPPFTARRLK